MRFDEFAEEDYYMYINENISPEMLTLEYSIED
jgi:hypothetical protein